MDKGKLTLGILSEDWNYCPIDIMLLIFKRLDVKTLENCMFVNRSWRDIAVYTLERYDLWRALVEKRVFNKGFSMRRKSKLDWKDIYFNYCAWRNLKKMAIDIQRIRQVEYVINLHVYKDLLIVVSNTNVTYLEISTFKVIKYLPMTVLDFEETDKVIAKLTGEGEARRLTLYGKSQPAEFDLSVNKINITEPVAYKIEEDSCYSINCRNVLWLYKWAEEKWHRRSIARHYGQSNLYGLSTYQNDESGYTDLIVFLESGEVLLVDTQQGSFFRKIFCMEIPEQVVKFIPIMFGISSCVISVPHEGKFEIVHQEYQDQLLMACPDLNCATQHGDVLFLGYKCGKVEIHFISRILETNGVPERCIDLQQLEQHYLSDPNITAIEVHESKSCHHLLIGCESRIYHLKLTLTYPSNNWN